MYILFSYIFLGQRRGRVSEWPFTARIPKPPGWPIGRLAQWLTVSWPRRTRRANGRGRPSTIFHGISWENHLSMRVSLTANIIQWLVVFKHSFFIPRIRIPLLWKEGWLHQHIIQHLQRRRIRGTEVVRFSISGIFVLPAGFAQANPRDWRGWTDAGRFYGVNQGLLNVPFWVYWTSPYSSHYRPYT